MVATPSTKLEGEPELERVELFGLLAEYDGAENLLRATRRAYAAGFRAMDAYSPVAAC